MIVVFRRIPAILLTYKLMPNCVADIKEAVFMGYFGPIGIGAVFYVEHTRHLFPEPGEALTEEENILTAAMIPVVYWLVVFSIFWHGLSIPALNLIYKYMGVQPIQDEDGPAVVHRLSTSNPLPKNSSVDERRGSIMINNRFSRSYNTAELDLNAVEGYRRRTQQWYKQQDVEGYGEKVPATGGVQFATSPHYQSDLQRQLSLTKTKESKPYI
jgi:sodium/hydrogen antiporter